MSKGLKISIILVALIFILSSYLFAEEQITITTYYPSPYGSYMDLEVRHQLRLFGDADGDGNLTRNDVLYILQRVVNLPVNDIFGQAVPDWVMDLNNSGAVDPGDAITLFRMLDINRPHNVENFFNNNPSFNNGIALTVSTGKVGIGTTAPGYSLHVSDARATSPAIGVIAIDGYGTSGGNLLLRQAEGWQGAPIRSAPTDNLGIIGFRGYTGSGFSTTNAAMIQAYPAEPWSAGRQGTNLAFSTTPVGTANPQTAMVISENGNVGIGVTAPRQKLEIDGNLQMTGANQPAPWGARGDINANRLCINGDCRGQWDMPDFDRTWRVATAVDAVSSGAISVVWRTAGAPARVEANEQIVGVRIVVTIADTGCSGGNCGDWYDGTLPTFNLIPATGFSGGWSGLDNWITFRAFLSYDRREATIVVQGDDGSPNVGGAIFNIIYLVKTIS